MVTPDDQFTIDAGQVSIVAEDDGYAGSTGCVEQFCSSGYDCLPSVASQGASHEVVEHVNNEDGGFVQFFHLFTVLKVYECSFAATKIRRKLISKNG